MRLKVPDLVPIRLAMVAATNFREMALKEMPSISPMAMRLIGKLARVDVDVTEVSHLIERDVLLCSQILKSINSARYARRTQVTRVSDAVVLLGLARLRRLALGLSVSNLFKRLKTASGWSPLRFNFHSAAVAVMAEALADSMPAANGQGALVAALLHDVGKYAIAVNLHREYELIIDLWSSSGKPVDECESEILGFDHAELSGIMLARWDLPVSLQQGVFYHHRPEAAPPDPTNEGKVPLCRLLNVADRFVRYLGIDIEPATRIGVPAYSLEFPGFEVNEVEILARFQSEYSELSEAFR